VSARVTIIDDSAEVADVIAEILEDAGHVVTRLPEPVSPRRVADTEPDLIVLDLLFPEHSASFGWKYMRTLHSSPRLLGVSILLCSGDTPTLRARQGEVDRDPTLEALAKPFSIEQMEDSVSRLLNLAPTPRWDEADLVLVADESSRFVDASEPILRALHLSRAELRRRSVADIVAYDSEWTEAEWARYREHGTWEGQVDLRRRDGTRLPALARAEIVGREPRRWHVARLTLDGQEANA
jgi:CheY-like chemotaxis protein